MEFGPIDCCDRFRRYGSPVVVLYKFTFPFTLSLRQGEKKLRTWKDGWNNLKFLVKLRFTRD